MVMKVLQEFWEVFFSHPSGFVSRACRTNWGSLEEMVVKCNSGEHEERRETLAYRYNCCTNSDECASFGRYDHPNLLGSGSGYYIVQFLHSCNPRLIYVPYILGLEFVLVH